MSKHTPGPWTANGTAIEAEAPNGRSDTVAHVYGDRDAPVRGSPRANAALISASPDLLAACEAALETFERRFPMSPTTADLRAAIAKARGKP
jgi:hypothetical protein